MKSILNLLIAIFFAALGLASCADHSPTSASSVSNEKSDDLPNIIVIFTDDHGYPDIGAYGLRSDVKTPHIDRLAKNGALMTQGYVTSPACGPSRASLMTGVHNSQLGILHNNGRRSEIGTQTIKSRKILAESLKDAGYATGMAGKWHLGPPHEIDQHGFDFFLRDVGNGHNVWNMNFEGEEITKTKHEGGYHINNGARFASTFIKKNKDKPFFFYWAPRAPHFPFDAPQHYVDEFTGDMPERRRQALAMIYAIDQGVGNIVKTLEDHQLINNTIIFILGDNGAILRTQEDLPLEQKKGWNGSVNAPLNGAKGTLFEGGIRIPFLVYWKGKISTQEFNHPVSALDISATSLGLARQSRQKDQTGVDLTQFLTGENNSRPHNTLFFSYGLQAAVRHEDWKLITLDKQRYLFDLSKDFEEKVNLADENPDKRKELETLLDAFYRDNSIPAPSHPNPERIKAITNIYENFLKR